MRREYIRIVLFSLAICLVTATAVQAGQRTARRFGKKEAERKSYSLDDIMASPREYLERDVLFYCRFATMSNLFKNVNTRFNSTQHVNFAVWPDKAVLWEESGRKNVLPTLYVAKNDPDTLEMIRTVKKYELLAVTGRVLNVYAGYPWIQITKIERIEKPSERLCEQVIEHMQSGHEALRAEAGGAAARHYEEALAMGLPCEFRAKAYEQVAHAYLLDNRLDLARDYLRQAVELDRNDPILHLALADVTLRMGDPGEAIAHSQFALERSGKYPQAYGIMGEALSLLGDYAKAFSNLNTAAGTPGITPREKAMVNVRRARIYARSGREPDAARLYVALSEPGEVLAGDASIHAEIGLFYERMYLMTGEDRYLDSAYAAFQEAARLGRVNPAMYYNAAEVEFRRQRLVGEDFGSVVQLIEKIYQIEPDYAAARVLEGRLLYAIGNVDEAEFRYQSVSGRIGDDAMALLALAEAYIDLDQTEAAAKAVERARLLEPWNERVQAIGEHLIDSALLTVAEPAVQDDIILDEETGLFYEDVETTLPVAAGMVRSTPEPVVDMATESAIARAEAAAIAQAILLAAGETPIPEAPARPNPEPQARQVETRTPPAREDLPGLRYASSAVPAPKPVSVPVVKTLQNADGVYLTEDDLTTPLPALEPMTTLRTQRAWPAGAAGNTNSQWQMPAPPAVRPAMATNTASTAVAPPAVYPTVTGSLRPPPTQPETIRSQMPPPATSAKPVRMDVLVAQPQEFQTLMAPEGFTAKGQRFPMTRVTLPPPLGQNKPENLTVSADRDDHFTLERLGQSSPESGPAPLQLGYEASVVDMLMPLPEASRGSTDGFNPEFGNDFDWNRDMSLPEQPRREDFLRTSQTVQVDNAYAMLPTPVYRPGRHHEGDMAKIPPVFSFSTDESPVILASVMSPGTGETTVPERNANVFRRQGGKRRPAEITESEPISPRLVLDASVMAPPAGGGVPRTEVRLPMSSRGLGMADNQYSPR